ncbi:AbrB family transcriptional regulator [Cohnella zeiphila]|uniref:AbrB family transcriptional regulator n=1 Tax=Cohnella zeiphila TaxID=2761120 RepID=A0A7X0SK71_9BACL|nr:AbrB family transcriptional regulator [Cohnella zeiphila]MBB6731381.1 AbrB family transcriptional regulator [Cohnella zeiphila]
MNKQRPSAPVKIVRYLITLVTALIGGGAFTLLNLPIPWLLGPMIAVLIGSNLRREWYAWPGAARNGAMIVVGYTIGLSLTAEALREMAGQLPTMLLMTVLLLLFCAGMAYAVSKLSGGDFLTALMGSVPGGLTQVLILAEETPGVNLTLVTVTQVIRLMMIIICVPLLIFSPLLGLEHDSAAAASAAAAQAASSASADWAALFPNILAFAPICVACAIGGSRIRFPTAYLLGPAFATAIVQLAGLHGPALPSSLTAAAQFAIGSYVGLLLRPGALPRKIRSISLALASGAALVLGALGLGWLLTRLHGVSMATALLSLAPGGMDQMGIIAHEVHADLSMVAGYQLFRTFFIFFLVPPLLRSVIRRATRPKAAGEKI